MKAKKKTKSKVSPKETPTHVLILRTCGVDMKSYGGFVWPESGPVEAVDWDQKPKCGSGLHGLLWGEGDLSLLGDEPKKWQVVKVNPSEGMVDLGGKVKFKKGEVVHCGTLTTALKYLLENDYRVPAGDRAPATAKGKNSIAACLGLDGRAMAGECGVVVLAYWDVKYKRIRVAVGHVGEDGIKAHTRYCVNDGKLQEWKE
jgi:hypothetical protein